MSLQHKTICQEEDKFLPTTTKTDSVPIDFEDGSEVSGHEDVEVLTERDPEVVVGGLTPAIRAALVELDHVDLMAEFSRRTILMKTIPHFFRNALRVGNGRSS